MQKPLGKKSMSIPICQGCWQPSPEQDTRVVAPIIKLVGYKTTREEIQVFYSEVNQMKRALGTVPCSPERAEELTQEILNSVKDCLQQRLGSTQPEEEPGRRPTSASRPMTNLEVLKRTHISTPTYGSPGCPLVGAGSCTSLGGQDRKV